MDLSLLQIWLLGCLIYYAYSSKVIRGEKGDTIIPDDDDNDDDCVKSCRQHGATCPTKKSDDCCEKCRCIGKTFYRKNLTQYCVLNPNKDEGCKYYLVSPKTFTWIKLRKVNVMKLGMLRHQEAKLFSYKCTITNKQYWDLLKWKDLNIRGKSFKIYQKTDHFLQLNIPRKNISKYKGYLIKLKINCILKKEQIKSCIIFKLLGERKYNADTESVIKPTKKPVTPTKKMKKKKSMLMIVIIAVSAAVLFIIVGIIIWWCWKKRRKENGKGNASRRNLLKRGEDPNYQNPDHISGRHSSEINNSANNLTYLQPVDAGLPYSSNSRNDNHHQKRKKDPNYDYPDVNLQNMSMKSDYQLPQDDISDEKPIYAEVSELRRPDPDYTDPNSFIKPRSVTEVVGVPGYQPPRGPFCDGANSSTYSSLDLISTDNSTAYQSLLEAKESDKTSKPPSPQYAEVQPEENNEIAKVETDENNGIENNEIEI